MNMRFGVLTVVSTKITAFWDVTVCGLVDVHQCFKGTSEIVYKATRDITSRRH
jgi:hypothetical protein